MRLQMTVILLCAACVLAAVWGYRWMYPYGERCCILPSIWIGLYSYAVDKEGSFPDDPKGPLAALSKLYPDYFAVGDEYVLAGFSGDENETSRALRNSEALNPKGCSWVYQPGLKLNDDPRIALLWEKEFGLKTNGRRDFKRRRVVLLVNGETRLIAENDWPEFQRQQNALKSAPRKPGPE